MNRRKCNIKKDISVLVPVLNEREAIGHVIDELISVGVPHDKIIVVDGGSTDGTPEIAKSKNVIVVKQYGKGKADAVRTGLEYVNTEYVAVIDGDHSYPAKYIVDMLKMICSDIRYDEIIGARIKGRKNIPLINRFGNWFLTKVFNFLFGTKLRDVLSGLYLIRTKVLSSALFETRGFSIEVEIAAHVASIGGEIGEVEIEYRKRKGQSKLSQSLTKSISTGVSILADMIRLAWRYNPASLIFSLGSLLLIPGIALGLLVAYHYFYTGVKYYVKGLVAIMLTLAGFHSLIAAVQMIYSKRMEKRIIRRIDALERVLKKLKKEEY